MQLNTSSPTSTPTLATIRERLLGDVNGALIFAASSITNEISNPRYTGATVVREVQTERGSYTLTGRRVIGPDGVQPIVLVYAEAGQPEPAPEDKLRERFRLTRKEARVALLLAQYMSNEQVAAELCISPHTARHHTQSVLDKLGIKSRKDVKPRIEST